MGKTAGTSHAHLSSLLQQRARISSSIAAERGIVSVIQSDFKDGGRSAENCRREMKGGGRVREGGLERRQEGRGGEVRS